MVVCALGGNKDLPTQTDSANLKMVIQAIIYWVFMMSTLSNLQKPHEVGAIIVFVVQWGNAQEHTCSRAGMWTQVGELQRHM